MMESNFSFLHQNFPALEFLGSKAEEYCFSDSNSSLIKLGMLGETIVNLIVGYDRISIPPDCNAASRINILKREGLLPDDIGEALHVLRKKRNDATHDSQLPPPEAVV